VRSRRQQGLLVGEVAVDRRAAHLKGSKIVFRGLAGAEPAFEVAAVDDAEGEENTVLRDEVVHDAVVADTEAVEGVSLAADRLDLLAADAAGSGCCLGELFEAGVYPLAELRWEFLVGALGSGREPDLVGVAQVMSRSVLERPRR
jgi:hypothetical protein